MTVMGSGGGRRRCSAGSCVDSGRCRMIMLMVVWIMSKRLLYLHQHRTGNIIGATRGGWENDRIGTLVVMDWCCYAGNWPLRTVVDGSSGGDAWFGGDVGGSVDIAIVGGGGGGGNVKIRFYSCCGGCFHHMMICTSGGIQFGKPKCKQWLNPIYILLDVFLRESGKKWTRKSWWVVESERNENEWMNEKIYLKF